MQYSANMQLYYIKISSYFINGTTDVWGIDSFNRLLPPPEAECLEDFNLRFFGASKATF